MLCVCIHYVRVWWFCFKNCRQKCIHILNNPSVWVSARRADIAAWTCRGARQCIPRVEPERIGSSMSRARQKARNTWNSGTYYHQHLTQVWLLDIGGINNDLLTQISIKRTKAAKSSDAGRRQKHIKHFAFSVYGNVWMLTRNGLWCSLASTQAFKDSDGRITDQFSQAGLFFDLWQVSKRANHKAIQISSWEEHGGILMSTVYT